MNERDGDLDTPSKKKGWRSKRRPFRVSNSTKEAIRLLAVASTMGLSMVLATVIGLAVGVLLDNAFDTKPWLTIIFLILGIIAGFKNIYVITRRVQKMEKEKDTK